MTELYDQLYLFNASILKDLTNPSNKTVLIKYAELAGSSPIYNEYVLHSMLLSEDQEAAFFNMLEQKGIKDEQLDAVVEQFLTDNKISYNDVTLKKEVA